MKVDSSRIIIQDAKHPPPFYKCFIDNKLQVADILEQCIADFSGSSRLIVRQATFSISEEFIRRIWNIKKKSGARFILAIDRKALQKTRILWRFLSAVYDEIYLADTHAKILLVDDEASSFSRAVITSQNLTRGNRYESTIITSDRDIFKELIRDFNTLVKRHSVPMHDIMPTENINLPELPQSSSTDDSEEAPSIYSRIEDLASIFMPISDIAVILELDPAELRDAIAASESPESRAYARGKAKAKAKIRAQEMELAQLGSPLGVQNVRDNLIDMEADE